MMHMCDMQIAWATPEKGWHVWTLQASCVEEEAAVRQLAGMTRPEEKRPTPQPQWSAKLSGYCRSYAFRAAALAPVCGPGMCNLP